MKNNEKNETGNKTNINIEIEKFPEDLKILLKYGKWQLLLISSLKGNKNYKKNLILIDKEWLGQWKELTGYNYIKNKIFIYLSSIQQHQQKNNNTKIIEENQKLQNFWENIKKSKKIDANNLQKLKPFNTKQYLLNYNNKMIIDGRSNFEVISTDIFDIFKKYYEKSVNIKVGGLFTKKKLLMPFNYNDNNTDYIYIDMMFIKDNKKNNIDEILFLFPKLKLNVIEKIRKDISTKEIDIFVNNFDNNNENEFYFNDIDGTKYTYKGIYKNKSNYNQNINNKITNKISLNNNNNKINENIIKDNDNNENIRINNNLNVNINDTKNISNLDVNNLSEEEIMKKMKEIEENINKMKEKENDITNNEKIYINEEKELKKQKTQFNKEKNTNKINNKNNNELEKEYHKYLEHLKEMESKNQNLFYEIEECKEQEKNLNNEYKKAKNDFIEKEKKLNEKINELDNKEKDIKIKDNKIVNDLKNKEIELNNKETELNIKEEDLKLKEQELNEKEIELNDEEDKNKKMKKEMQYKKEEILLKLKILKNAEDENNEIINNEVDEEIKELEKKVNQKKKLEIKSHKNIITNIKIDEEGEDEEEEREKKAEGSDKEEEGDLEEEENEMNIDNNKFQNKNTLNESNNIKYRKIKSLNQDNIIPKINSGRYSVNINISKENKKIKDGPKYNTSKTLTSSNLDNININLLKKNISMLSSIGLNKQNKIINLNALIQCFAHLKEITESILNLDNQNFFNQKNIYKLSKLYAIIINNIFYPEKFNNTIGVYSISDFLDFIIKENQILKNKSFVNFDILLNIIIEGLHKELNTKKNTNSLIDDKQYEGINEKDALCKYLENFTKNNNSIISKYLFGLLKKKIICQGCKKEKYNFKCYSFLNFNLSEIKNFINQPNRSINLYDFFDYYNKPEYFVGEKGLFCNKCNSKNTTTIIKSIYSSHIILPIIINRGDDSNLIKDKINFPDDLDISNYIEYKNTAKHFYLCGVISNFGMSNNFGKFQAFCRMEQNSPWFLYNNEQVSSCNSDDVHNKGIPYVLFYHKVNK